MIRSAGRYAGERGGHAGRRRLSGCLLRPRDGWQSGHDRPIHFSRGECRLLRTLTHLKPRVGSSNLTIHSVLYVSFFSLNFYLPAAITTELVLLNVVTFVNCKLVCFVLGRSVGMPPFHHVVSIFYIHVGNLRIVFINTPMLSFDTLRPRQNCHHSTDDISKCIILNGNVWISLNISLKFVPNVRIKILQNWFRWWLRAGQAIGHYLKHICATRPHWLKGLTFVFVWFHNLRHNLHKAQPLWTLE